MKPFFVRSVPVSILRQTVTSLFLYRPRCSVMHFNTLIEAIVCLFVDLAIKGTWQTPTKGYKHQAGNSQFPHTNIGLTSMIMNSTNQEVVIHWPDLLNYNQYPGSSTQNY